MTITWTLAYIMCNQQIDNNEKCRQIAGDFDCHADAAVQCGAHRPMEHILGFTQSHWMLPLGECSHRHYMAKLGVLHAQPRKKVILVTKNYK